MGQARRRSLPNETREQSGLIGVLDIGTSKVCCLIAAGTNPPRLLGLGHQRARGIRSGGVVDLDAAEQAIRATVAQAERQAGVTIESVHVSIAGGHLQSKHFAASADLARGIASEADVNRLIRGAVHFCQRNGRTLVHMNRLGYRLDASPGVRDPRGMAGLVLAGDIHAVTAGEGPVHNLNMLIERCFLRTTRFTPAAVASARAVATPEEMRKGVTVIDFGAGTTSIGAIADGHDLLAASIPAGGNDLTLDIATALGTSVADAERIKVLYGTMVQASSDERDVVTYPRANDSEEDLHQTTRAQLRQLIVPRVESLLSQAMEKLVASGLDAYAGHTIVMTGGASQLLGLPLFAGRFWGRSVRLSAPQPFSGMGPSSSSPAFATAVGLVVAAANPETLTMAAPQDLTGGQGYVGRVGQWLRESF